MLATRSRRPKRYQVPALKRAFAILDNLNQSSFGLTVQQISRAHKLPYSTAFYLLETMRECGYVQRNHDSRKYTLGYKLFAFREGNAARNTLNLRAASLPLLEELTELTDLTGLTVHLAILDKDEALYIEKTEPPGFIRLNTCVGKRNKLHCSAVGKALLGYLSEAESRKLCPPSSLTRRTNRTITSLTVLLADLAKVRLRGYAIDDGEDEAEGRCVAAPVFCADGKVVASVSVSGTMTQIDVHKLDALGKLVRNYAAQISGRLGYTASERKKGASGP